MKRGIVLKVLSFFRRPSLQPTWTFTAPGVLWRLFPAKSGELIGESRDQEKKLASFFALDSRTGDRLWEGLTLDEPWWVGIEDVTEGVLVLHKFGSPDMPGHRGIIGVDLRRGRAIWTNDELTFWFAYKQSIYAHKLAFERNQVYEIDALSGRLTREIASEEERALLKKKEEALIESGKDLLFPDKGIPAQVEPAILNVLAREIGSPDRFHDSECLVLGNVLVMNYHLRSKRSGAESILFDNHLIILDANRGRMLFSDCINRDSAAVVPDSFFVRKGMLLYVKDQKTLTAIMLPQE